jgi:bacterioferritin-associated ferredoxin
VIVCVCNALRERQVREAARAAGQACAHRTYARLGAKVKCGQCLPYAREVIEGELARA